MMQSRDIKLTEAIKQNPADYKVLFTIIDIGIVSLILVENYFFKY